MAFTMQQIVDLARVPLNDARKVRYSDASLLGYANSAVHRAYEIRPDLAIGSYGTPFAALVLGGTFPLPDRYAQTLADYVGGRAETKDEDAASGGRAELLLKLFERELLS